jgi:hypothetical protein
MSALKGHTMALGIKTACDAVLERIGRHFARKLNQPVSGYKPYTPSDFATLCQTLEVGDVLLVEGGERISGAIKYLTQSTWSHAALYVALLRISVDERFSPFPRRIYPTAFVTGMPRAV